MKRLLNDRALARLYKGRTYTNVRPRRCVECDRYPADLPSKLCAGCEAYREHTGFA